jgi:hypothetical protein
MAAAYFLTSLFVLLLGRHPRNRLVRTCACLLVLAAMILTGSNGALGPSSWAVLRRRSSRSGAEPIW